MSASTLAVSALRERNLCLPGEGYRPTPLQRTMFHRSQERPNTGLYVHQQVWRAPGRIDPDHAQLALKFIAVQHEPLRAYFRLGAGREPRLFFATDVVVDVPRLIQIDNEVELDNFLAADRRQAFDFENPPLWRMAILRGPAEDCVLWTYHHILIDGPSRAIIFQEWQAALRAIAAGLTPQLAPVPRTSFADHLVALEAAETTAAAELWREQLDGFMGGTPLPAWPVQPAGATSLTSEETQIEDVKELSARARSHGATLNAVIQGAWALALARYNKVEDVTFGTTRTGRHLHGQARVIASGMFITTVPFRVDARRSQAVGSWLKRLAEQQVALRVGEFASPSQIRHWAKLSPELPMFPTVLVFTQDEFGEAARAKGELRDVTKAEGVTLAAYAGRHLRLYFEYPSDEYAAEQMRAVLSDVRAYIVTLLQAVPDDTLAMIEMRASEIIRPAYSPPAPPARVEFARDNSVVDFIRLAARQRPDASAIIHAQSQLRFGQLDKRSDLVAALLRQSGLQIEEPVALFLDRSIEFVVAALGVLKAGGSYLSLDPHAPARRIAQIIAQSGARWALTVPDMRKKLAEWGGNILDINAFVGNHSDADYVRPNMPERTSFGPHRRAYLICTSGSTGAPKMVEVEHHSLTNLVFHYQRYLQLTASDRATWLSSPAFDASVSDLWPCLCSGGTVVISDKEYASDPDGLIEWIAKEAITFAFVPTPLAELLLRRPWPKKLALRFFSTGGDVLHTRPSSDLPFAVLNRYGPTENTVDATWSIVQPRSTSTKPPAIGRPIANVTAYVLDNKGHSVPPGEVGELYLGGEQVARGYLNEANLTRERFVPDPFAADGSRLYRTGDMVRWNKEEELEFLGRIDLQVQIGGRRVELQEIESVLARHSSVVEVCCTPIRDGQITRDLVVHVATSEASADLASRLRSFLNAELPAYMIPSQFIFHDSLPHTHAGKIDRAQLAARTPHPVWPTRATSADNLDGKLRALWCELLPSAVGTMEETFWNSGGDSLKLIQLFLGVEEITDCQLLLPQFLKEPTLRGLLNIAVHSTAKNVPASSAHSRGSESEVGEVGRQTTVLELQRSGSGVPVYFIQAGPYHISLAQAMGCESPIFCIDAPWPSSWRRAAINDPDAMPTIEQLAAPYATALFAEARSTPCVLVGHSIAGMIAFEAAHQLQKLGGKVEAVLLLDTWLKRPPAPSFLFVAWNKLHDRWYFSTETARLEQSTFAIGQLRRAFIVFVWMMRGGMSSIYGGIKRVFHECGATLSRAIYHESLDSVLGDKTVFEGEGRVLSDLEIALRLYKNADRLYQPFPINCRGILLTADDERKCRRNDDSLGWRDYFTKGLEIIPTPGGHHSMIIGEEHLFALATRVNDALRADPGRPAIEGL